MKTIPIKLLILVILLISAMTQAFSKNFYTHSSGKWTSRATWGEKAPGNWIEEGDTIFISHPVDLNIHVGCAGVLVLNENASLCSEDRNIALGGNAVLQLNGNLTVENLLVYGGTIYCTSELNILNDLKISGPLNLYTSKAYRIGNKVKISPKSEIAFHTIPDNDMVVNNVAVRKNSEGKQVGLIHGLPVVLVAKNQ